MNSNELNNLQRKANLNESIARNSQKFSWHMKEGLKHLKEINTTWNEIAKINAAQQEEKKIKIVT